MFKPEASEDAHYKWDYCGDNEQKIVKLPGNSGSSSGGN